MCHERHEAASHQDEQSRQGDRSPTAGPRDLYPAGAVETVPVSVLATASETAGVNWPASVEAPVRLAQFFESAVDHCWEGSDSGNRAVPGWMARPASHWFSRHQDGHVSGRRQSLL